MHFSVIIPVYNEERRIPKTIDRICAFFSATASAHRIDIIFVNDGSTDTTEVVLKEYQKKFSFELISYSENKGKGYAIRQGALAAKGEWVVFFDIDLATPLEEFNQLLTSLTISDAVVIGSRRLAGSRIQKSESRIRVFLGHGFTKLSNILVPKVTDFTCGFKCFSQKAVQTVFPRALINRWGFDTELLYIAHIHKLPIRQIPVAWTHDTDSKVRVGKAIISSLSELIQMAYNRYSGRYR